MWHQKAITRKSRIVAGSGTITSCPRCLLMGSDCNEEEFLWMIKCLTLFEHRILYWRWCFAWMVLIDCSTERERHIELKWGNGERSFAGEEDGDEEGEDIKYDLRMHYSPAKMATFLWRKTSLLRFRCCMPGLQSTTVLLAKISRTCIDIWRQKLADMIASYFHSLPYPEHAEICNGKSCLGKFSPWRQ